MFLTVDAVKPVGSLNARNIKRVRYCLGAAVDGKTPLIRQQQTWNVETPPPSYSTASCDEKGTGGWESTQVVATDVVNTDARDAGADLPVHAGARPARRSRRSAPSWRSTNPDKSPSAVSLGTGVFLRNQNRKPVASCTTSIYTGTGKQVAPNGSDRRTPRASASRSTTGSWTAAPRR